MSKVVVFHGIDHKVGTTLLVQSVAEWIAKEQKHLSVMMISMNARKSTEYVREVTESIENFRIQLDNRMLDANQIMKLCQWKSNLYLLSGIGSQLDHRSYHPDHAGYLLRMLEDQVDLILIDSGNEIDHGLAVGALAHSQNRFLILTQQESMLHRYEQLNDLYQELSIQFSGFIINKFQTSDPYNLSYIQKRTGIPTSIMKTISYTEYYRQAEMEYRSLVSYQDARMQADLAGLSREVMSVALVPSTEKKRKISWKNFI